MEVLPMAEATHGRLAGIWRDWRGFLVFVAIMLVVRSAVADWNNVPSGSMMPAILIGDRILVDKLAYDLRVPFTLHRVARWRDPARGDIVTFVSPEDGRLFVKRVIGMPGETVMLDGNRLTVDGEPAAYAALDEADITALGLSQVTGFVFLREMVDGTEHVVMLDQRATYHGHHSFGPVEVPLGHYLMLGDNRDHSGDSRNIGFVSRDRILGRAHGVAFSLDHDNYFIPRGGRFFEDLE
jgi:signal peptidase I